MAWIHEPPAEDPIFDSIRGPKGVDDILRVHGLAPGALKAHLRLYKELLFGTSPLTRAQREMIGVTVSTANQCHY
jgi:alkylhydroperoxidase family enzyme